MGEPIPLYQELQLPVVPPEVMEELKNAKKSEEQTYRRVVIDLTGDTPDEKVPFNSDS